MRFLGATWEGFVNTSPTTNSSLLHQLSTDTERSINVSFYRTTRIHIKTSWARNAFDSIEEVYRDNFLFKVSNNFDFLFFKYISEPSSL